MDSQHGFSFTHPNGGNRNHRGSLDKIEKKSQSVEHSSSKPASKDTQL